MIFVQQLVLNSLQQRALFGVDEETGQTVISGMGELHLEIIVDRLKREFKVEANIGNPQVAYRETFRKAVKTEGKYIKQSGGKGNYGHCWLEMTPLEPGSGFEFENKIVGGALTRWHSKSLHLWHLKMV